jgi:hypothetical protein
VPIVSKTKGTLSVKPTTGQEHAVETAQRTREGDSLQTAADSLADIALADSANVRLGPQTSARVLRTDGGLTLDLIQGGLCVVASSGQVGISSGVTLTTATAPVIYSVARDDAGATVLAVYRGEVRTGGGLSARAGQAFTLAPTGAETAVLLKTVDPGLAPLECPDPSVIADAEANQLPLPEPPHSGGGGGGVLGIIGGLGLLAAAAGGGGGGKGGGSTPVPTPAPQPTAVPGSFSVSPTSEALITGNTAIVTASELNYTGPITAVSTNKSVATVTASGSGPNAAFTVTAVAPGSATLTFADNHGGVQNVGVTVTAPAGTLGVSPATVSLVTGKTATVTASESNYTGAITATSSPTSIATVTATGNGPSATYTVNAVAPGAATLTFKDNHGGSKTVSVTVIGPLTLNKTTLALGTSNGAFTATELNYTGQLSVTASTPNIVSVTPASGAGPGPVTFTVAPLNGGSTTLTVSDGNTPAQTASISVTVSSSALVLNPTQLSLSTGNGSTPKTGTFTATELNYTQTLSASVASGGVTVAPGSGTGPGPVTFTVTATAPGPAVIAVADNNALHQSFVTVNVTGPLSASASVSGASGTLTATEPNYSGSIYVVLAAGCANVVTLATSSPQTANGGSAAFALTAKAAGQCTATVTDDHNQTATPTITVSAGTLNATADTQTINMSGLPTSATITASETPFSGSFSATSSAPGVASVSSVSNSGSPATFTVSAVSGGTANITVSDGTNSKVLAFTVTGPLNAGPDLSFTTSATLTATEPYYSGPLTATPKSCSGIISPSTPQTLTASGGSASFTYTAVKQGNCSVTVTDNHSASDIANIAVTAGAFSISPYTAQTINLFGNQNGATQATNPFPLTATEANFFGTFTASSTNSSVATIVPSGSSSGPSAKFTVTATGTGTATINVDDATFANTRSFTITVTGLLTPPAGPLVITPAQSSGTLTAAELNYTGSITAALTGCNNVVSQSADGTGPSATFTFNAIAAGTCSVTFSDTHGQTTASTQITVQPGTLGASADASIINAFGTAGKTATITATELHFGGTLTASSSDGTVATVSASSGSGPSETFTVTAAGAGTADITVSDGTQSSLVHFTVTGQLASPGISLQPPPANSGGNLGAAEPYYGGQLNASADPLTCTGLVASIAASATASGDAAGSATFPFTLDPTNLVGGSCNVTISDDHGSSITAIININASAPSSTRRRRFSPIGLRRNEAPPASAQPGQLTADATNLTLRRGAVRTISLVETGYAGAFAVANSQPDVVTALLASTGAGSAHLTLTAQANGSTLLTVSDANGNRLTIPVTVSAASRSLGPVLRRPFPGDTTPPNSPAVPKY